MVKIGSNISSLQAQRRLAESGSVLSRTYQRLSSGQRINTASDDAAGLAIADGFGLQKRLWNVAIRNINDAVSVTNIIGGALSAQSDILARLQELAEQSANGVYSSNQRRSLNHEYQQLVAEFGRIGDSTYFNGINLLSGKDGAQDLLIQAGITGGENSAVLLNLLDTSSFSGRLGIRSEFGGDGFITATDIVAARYQSTSWDGINDYFYNSAAYQTVRDSNGNNREVWIVIAAAKGNASGMSPPFTHPVTVSELDFFIRETVSTDDLSSVGEFTQVAGWETGIVDLDVTFGDGATATVSLDLRGMQLENYEWFRDVPKTAINFTGVETAARARDALDTVNRRRDDLAQAMGQVGAIQSRLAVAAQVAMVQSEAVAAAEAAVRDADLAQEAAELVRAQILQQAGVTVLAQANLQPALVLQLLEN